MELLVTEAGDQPELEPKELLDEIERIRRERYRAGEPDGEEKP